jgi:hypothetical protein
MGVDAGWFPDPSGVHRVRYWDGTAWSEYVADASDVISDPLVGGASEHVVPSGDARVDVSRVGWKVARILSAVMLLVAGLTIFIAVFLPWAEHLELGPGAVGPQYTGWDFTHCWRGPWKGCGIYYGDQPPSNPRNVVVATIICAAVFVTIGCMTLLVTLRGRRPARGVLLAVGWTAVVVGGIWNLMAQSYLTLLWGWKVVNAAGVLALVGMIVFTIVCFEPGYRVRAAPQPEAVVPLTTPAGASDHRSA